MKTLKQIIGHAVFKHVNETKFEKAMEYLDTHPGWQDNDNVQDKATKIASWGLMNSNTQVQAAGGEYADKRVKETNEPHLRSLYFTLRYMPMWAQYRIIICLKKVNVWMNKPFFLLEIFS